MWFNSLGGLPAILVCCDLLRSRQWPAEERCGAYTPVSIEISVCKCVLHEGIALLSHAVKQLCSNTRTLMHDRNAACMHLHTVV